MAARTRMRLGEMLVRAGIIDELQLKSALARQRDHGNRIGRAFIELGFTNQRMVGRALAKQLGVPFMDLCDLTGADVVLAKPVRPAEFLAVMRQVWHERPDPVARRKAEDMLAEGREHDERGEVDDAVDCIRAACEHDPRAFEPLQTLAIVLENAARPYEAIAAYELAARTCPNPQVKERIIRYMLSGI